PDLLLPEPRGAGLGRCRHRATGAPGPDGGAGMTSTTDQIEPATERQESMFATLRGLWPYIWPEGRPDLKQRVVVALLILVAAKILTVLIPYTYKWATDALVAVPTAGTPSAGSLGLLVVLTVPIMLVVANGVGRILMNVFN